MVFHYPFDRRVTYIKRVVGMPGDRLRITSRDCLPKWNCPD